MRVLLLSVARSESRQDQQQWQRQAAPAFAVRPNDLFPLAPRATSYAGQPVSALLR